jgi:hypothetical protein
MAQSLTIPIEIGGLPIQIRIAKGSGIIPTIRLLLDHLILK